MAVTEGQLCKKKKNAKKCLPVAQQEAPKGSGNTWALCPFFCPTYNQEAVKASTALSEEDRSLTPLSACGSDEQAPSSAPVPRDRQGPQSVSPAGETDRPHRSRSPRERGSRTDTWKSYRPQLSDVEDRLLSLLQEPLPKPDSQLDQC